MAASHSSTPLAAHDPPARCATPAPLSTIPWWLVASLAGAPANACSSVASGRSRWGATDAAGGAR
jgi:hypothetical protein